MEFSNQQNDSSGLSRIHVSKEAKISNNLQKWLSSPNGAANFTHWISNLVLQFYWEVFKKYTSLLEQNQEVP